MHGVRRVGNTNRGSTWAGWSPTITNTRFQSREVAGLSAADVPRLTLKWALGFPTPRSRGHRPRSPMDASTSAVRTAPCIRSTRRRDAFTGPTVPRAACAPRLLSVRAGGIRRSCISATRPPTPALNAETGRVVWTRKVDDHPLARITGSPTLHAGRLYVPVSSHEESQAPTRATNAARSGAA